MDDLCRSRFIECYGELGEHLDEETWLAWLGIWVSAWREFEPIIKRLRNACRTACGILDEKWERPRSEAEQAVLDTLGESR